MLRVEEHERAFERFWRGSGDRPGLRARARDRARHRRAARRPRLRRGRRGSRSSSPLSEISQSRSRYNGGRGTGERTADEALAHTVHPHGSWPCSSRSLVVAAGGAAIAVAAFGGAARRRRPSRSRRRSTTRSRAPEPAGHHRAASPSRTSSSRPARCSADRRLGADVRRRGPALGDERRPRPDRAAVRRGRRADRLGRHAGDGLRRVLEHRLQADLPARARPVARATDTPPHARAIIDSSSTDLGAHATLSAAQPTNVAGPARLQRHGVAEARRRPARLRRARLGRGARRPAAGRASTRRGSSSPVLELAVTDISYGAVATSDVDVSPPAGAKIVDLSSRRHGVGLVGSGTTPRDRARRRAGGGRFPVVAPDTLVGLPRAGRAPRRLGDDGARRSTARASARSSSSSARPTRRRRPGRRHARRACRPSRSTASPPTSSPPQLGTVLEWQIGRRRAIVLAGSLPAAAAEAAAARRSSERGGRRPVEARGLVKRYGDIVAVDHVDLTVERRRRVRLPRPERRRQDDVAADAARPDPPDAPARARSSGATRCVDGARALDGVAGFVEGPRFYPYLCGRRTSSCSPTTTSRARSAANRRGARARRAARPRARTASAATRTACASGSASPASLLRQPRLLLLDEPTTGPRSGRDARHARRSCAASPARGSRSCSRATC